MNPVYFNAAHSLGLLLEIALDAEAPRHVFMHQFVKFMSDFEDARRLEEDARTALSAVDGGRSGDD